MRRAPPKREEAMAKPKTTVSEGDEVKGFLPTLQQGGGYPSEKSEAGPLA